MKITREFYIPKEPEKVLEYDDVNAIAYYYTLGVKPTAVCFAGRRQKPDLYHTYKSEDQRAAHVQKWIDGLRAQKAAKERWKKERAGALSGPAQTAKVLKGLLQEFFPGVKFSCKSEIYSMGNAVRISYADGPLEEEVKSIANLFQYGRFDGMQDMAYTVEIKVPNCKGAKYVSVNRKMSPELKAEVLAVLKDRFNARYSNGERIEDYAPYQVGQAEMILKGITQEELDRRNQKRQETITALAVLG